MASLAPTCYRCRLMVACLQIAIRPTHDARFGGLPEDTADGELPTRGIVPSGTWVQTMIVLYDLRPDPIGLEGMLPHHHAEDKWVPLGIGVLIAYTILFNILTWMSHAYLGREQPPPPLPPGPPGAQCEQSAWLWRQSVLTITAAERA